MAITDKQYSFIELYITGENISNIAKKLGCTRQSCYNWLDKDDIRAEIDRRLTQIKSHSDNKLQGKLDVYLSELEGIAFHSKSDKVKADVLQYLVDRVLGKTTTKVADVSQDKELKNIDIDKELAELDNVIDLEDTRQMYK